MKTLIIRYVVGFLIGVLLMSMGRYKIHAYQVAMLAICIVLIVVDVINTKKNEKGKRNY